MQKIKELLSDIFIYTLVGILYIAIALEYVVFYAKLGYAKILKKRYYVQWEKFSPALYFIE